MASSEYNDLNPPWPPQSPANRSRGASFQRGPQSRVATSVATALARAMLLLPVLVTPWLFGGVQADIQAICFPLAWIGVIGWFITLRGDHPVDTLLPLATVPLLLAVVWGAGQLLPLPTSTLAALSPTAEALIRQADDPPAVPTVSEVEQATHVPWRQASIYPLATTRQLANLLLATTMFLLASRFFRQTDAVVWLLGLIAVNGGAMAFFGLVQSLSWNHKIYWVIPLSEGGQPFGAFVNRNNAGGWLCLSLAAAAGLLVYALRRSHEAQSPDRLLYALEQQVGQTSWWSQTRLKLLRTLAALDGLTLLALTAVVLSATGILASLSRGAVLAMIGAVVAVVLASMIVGRHGLRALIVAPIAVTALALVAWLGFAEHLELRMANLLQIESIQQENRLGHWADSLQAASHFLLTGSGLGTYPQAYPPFEQGLTLTTWHHAENQYLEALLEGGIPGLLLLCAAIGLVGYAALSLWRQTADSLAVALAVTGVFALASQVIQGGFDFGLYIPSNMLLMAVLCGAICGRASTLAFETGSRSLAWIALPRRSVVTALLILGLLAGMQFGWRQALAAAQLDDALKTAQNVDGRPPRDTALTFAREQLADALRANWNSVQGQRRMAQSLALQFRADAMAALLEELGAEADTDLLWSYTSRAALHAQAARLARDEQTAALRQLREQPSVVAWLRPAVDHLLAARRACPLVADTHLMLAELAWVAPDRVDEYESLQRAERLAPGRVDILYRVGLLYWNHFDDERALAAWRASGRLSDRFAEPILRKTLERLSIDQALEALRPAPAAGVYQLARRLDRSNWAVEPPSEVGRAMLEYALRLLDLPSGDPADDHYLRATIQRHLGRNERAVDSLLKAVELRPQQVSWRFELAQLLLDLDRPGEALEHARECRAMEPGNPRYEQLLRQIDSQL